MRISSIILIGLALVLVCALVFVSVILYVSLVRAPGVSPVITPIAQAPTPALPIWYEVYFTEPHYPDSKASHHGGIDDKLTAFIDTAARRVDMAIYQLDLSNVTQALIHAQERGVVVRIVTDVDSLNDDTENKSFKALMKAGIPVVGGNPNGIMHDKFVVVDDLAVWTGSWNFTENDTYRYNNNAILIRSPQLAHNYATTFEKMFTGKAFGGTRKPGGTSTTLAIAGVTVKNYFSPEDHVADKIVTRLQKATKTIDFMAFSFTHDGMGQAIMDRVAAGVKVRGVFETTGSGTKFSEFGSFKKVGLDVMQDGNPYLMHHKVILVDAQTVVFGSFNFSAGADEENDENLLMIDDPGLIRAFDTEFAKVYDQAKNSTK